MSIRYDETKAPGSARLLLPVSLCILPLFVVTMIFLGLRMHSACFVVPMWFLGIVASIIATLLGIGNLLICVLLHEYPRFAVFLLATCLNAGYLWAAWQISQFKL